MLNNDPGTGAGEAARPVGPQAATRNKRWWLRNWRLRYKMAAVLLVPTLAALGVGGVRVYDGLSTAGRLHTIVEQVELAQRTANLTHELQRERDFAVVQTTSNGPGMGDYNGQAQRVDQAVQQFRAFGGQTSDLTPEVRAAYQSANNRLDSLGALRNTVSHGFTSPQALVAYDSILDSVLQIDRAVATSAANTQVNQAARTVEAVSRMKEQLAQERSILLAAALRGEFLTGQTDAVRAADARYEAAYAEFQNSATPQQQALYSAKVAGAAIDRTQQLEQTALINGDRGNSLGVDPLEWSQQSGVRTDLVRDVESQLLTEFHDDADSYASSAQWAVIRDSLLVLMLLVIAFGVAAFIARSMLRPLRTLRYGALEIAQQSLPDAINQINENPGSSGQVSVPPVPVHTSEEIGQVARSFDAVHQQALRLASEQALLRTNVNDLFVNLARRSQTLVQRQLALIDRLEQDEQDPDQLSSLFELDHLATRMRRNNENLLILGGTDLTRRVMRPVPLSEVIGAAVSEVEQYARIAVVDSPDLGIQGRVVNDFIHLVAELLENATVFSNPDTEVTVRTAYRRQELVVEIRDRGVGIDAEEIDEINERLTRPPEIDVAVSRRMGLFVVGQLARRHDITVQLQNNGDLEGGATATVQLSGEYVVQMTPEGPKPMPDVPRAPGDERRDSLTETGTHLGLAAAFGQAGRAADVDPPTERAPLPDVAEPTPVVDEFAETGAAPEETSAALSTGYSVRMSTGDAFGASDVPRWEDEDQALADDGVRAEEWPGEEAAQPAFPDGLDGQCGVTGSDLFRSPFEAEKTTQLSRIEVDDSVDDIGPGDSEGATEDRQQPASADSAPVNQGDDPPATADESKGASWDMDDAPTQRLPIYEAVLSQWFRESDVDEPVVPGAFPADEPEPAEVPVNGSAPVDQPEPEPEPEPEPLVTEHPRTSTPDPGWGSADVGWKAAEALVQQTQQVQETTAAGLPKRVPKSNLVPGSAASPSQPAARRKPATNRSAEAVRGRMSNFQQGVRRGRHAKAEPVTGESRSIPSRPEEQE
ncbi:sensor histidine kinase [Saccharopolyspora rosea]|nr:nitrate- and nitrite sensing domain-containing protein [Saccharopolyspora rosea]